MKAEDFTKRKCEMRTYAVNNPVRLGMFKAMHTAHKDNLAVGSSIMFGYVLNDGTIDMCVSCLNDVIQFHKDAIGILEDIKAECLKEHTS